MMTRIGLVLSTAEPAQPERAGALSSSKLAQSCRGRINAANRVEYVKISDHRVPKYISEFWASEQRQATSISEISYRAVSSRSFPDSSSGRSLEKTILLMTHSAEGVHSNENVDRLRKRP